MCLLTITENAPRRVLSQFRECLGPCIFTTVAMISRMEARVPFAVLLGSCFDYMECHQSNIFSLT